MNESIKEVMMSEENRRGISTKSSSTAQAALIKRAEKCKVDEVKTTTGNK